VQGLTGWVRSARFVAPRLTSAALIAGFLWLPATAQAKYASIVVDGDTGEVVQQVNADDINYPASLTKMMTLYLVFEALESGRLKLDQTLPISAHAASRAPSKLGLEAGDSIVVRDLILALVTKSANDAAAAAAEGLAGSESAFAERMTLRAHKLGMKNTVFYNASGLPNKPENHTTARDLAILARALYRDFPQHYHYFGTREFSYHGAVFANHNHLMNSFQGMDGIKTGYINASGFNLAASAVREHRRLIGIVMGGESARARDRKMAQLLNEGFANRRGKIMVAKAEAEETAETAPADAAADAVVATEAPADPAPATPARAHAAVERWGIQLGAFSHHQAAERAARTALARLPIAKGKSLQILAPSRTDKERFYRVRVVDFSKREADKACTELHRHHQKCALVAPAST
jgi:D-alanyl-D-alanine carboxypeptidase